MTDHTNSDDDRRIDDLARAAGQELRRPAPAHGLAGVRTTTRRRKAVRTAGAGAACVVILAGGAFALTRKDDDHTVVPADTTITAPTTPTTVTPDTTTPDSSTPDSTVTPTTGSSTSVPPNASGNPQFVYATTGFIPNPDYLEHVIDPVTGEEIRTQVPDGLKSSDVQQALIASLVVVGRSDDAPLHPELQVFTSRFAAGDISYAYESRFSDSPEIPDEDPAVLALFDRCGQSELTVVGADRGEMPARVYSAAMSLDRRWLATVTVDCPAEGTLVDSQVAGVATLTVFDAAHPETAGRVITSSEEGAIGALFFSPDGDYLAVESDGGEYRVFDLADGSEIDVTPSGCAGSGSRYARFAGPWVGESTIVLALDCALDGVSMLVHDVATGAELRVPLPAATTTPADAGFSYLVVEVDYATYDRPENAWFTMCELAERKTCWYGHGSDTPVEIPGSQEASFLPLGFTPGG